MGKLAAQKIMEKYGANVGGFYWNIGTTAQFIFGLLLFSPIQILSSLFNVASPCTYMFLGHKNWGVALGGTFGIIGTVLAVYPQIIKGEVGSIFGAIAFFIFVSFGIFSAFLTRRYNKAKEAIISRDIWASAKGIRPGRISVWAHTDNL